MKKYLMTAAAALILGGLMTSCTKDTDYSGGGAQSSQDVQKTYEEAFLSTFGRPVEGLDWGFGLNTTASTRALTRAVSDYANYKGSMKPTVNGVTYTFPSAPDFPTSYPTGAEYYAGGYKYFNGGTIYMDENTSKHVEVQGYVDMYIVKSGTGEGNVTIESTDYWYVGNVPYGSGKKIRVFVCPGVTLKIPTKNAGNLQANVEYYFAPGSNLVCEANLPLNGTHIYMAGNTTTTVPNLEVNNNGVFYNIGTATIASKITVENNNSIVVNDGTLTATSLQTKGSGRVQNNAETTISDYTIINSNDNIWVNNGHYKTKYFAYTATSSSVINNCFLEVDENFMMNIADGSGDFKIDAGGGVLAKNFYGGGPFTAKDNNNNDATFNGGPFKITMGANSVFKVTNEAHMNALASAIATAHYGFNGVGTNYAVLQANKILKDSDGEGNVAYSGKLYVSAEEHFAQGYSGQYPYIHYYDGCTAKNIYAPGFESGIPDVKIDVTPCNPGFNGNTTPPSGGVDPDATEVMVVAEDLSTYVTSDGKELADFDFNDVVFEVSKGNGMVHIKLLAAGGTLPLTVGDPGQQQSGDNYEPTMTTEKDSQGNDMGTGMTYEVHRLFKVSTGTMVNTNSTSNGAERDPVEFDVPYPNGVTSASTIYEIANAIPIRVNRTDLNTNEKGWIEIQKAEEVSTSATRITASKLCVDKTYTWCNERIHIDQNFQYIDAYGNNKGSRFRMYLRGELKNYWWRGTTTVEGN